MKEQAKIAIAKLIGDVRLQLLKNEKKVIPVEQLQKMGYCLENGMFQNKYAIKDGIKVCIEYHNSNGTYDAAYGFYYGLDHRYCHFASIDEKIDDILACGFSSVYIRSQEMQSFIDTLKSKIDETRSLIANRGIGPIGGTLQSKGYLVTYNGSSWCTFSKDGIQYNASCTRRWELTDRITLYVDDDVLSADFSVEESSKINGLKYLELFVGDQMTLGRELTEMDKLPRYKKFRVRTSDGEYLDTVKWFEDFEEAKKYAYDLAVEKAKNVKPYCREWANTDPKDRGKQYDLLACYVWYECNHRHYLVFVQGEE